MEINIWNLIIIAFSMSFGLGSGMKLVELIYSKKKNPNKLEIVVDRAGVEIIEKKRLVPTEYTNKTRWEGER